MLLGGLGQWTVGLLATVMAVACIVAADVGAYFFGKQWGRTKLTEISPKKTVEGAVGGLLCSTGVAVAFCRFLRLVMARAGHAPQAQHASQADLLLCSTFCVHLRCARVQIEHLI